METALAVIPGLVLLGGGIAAIVSGINSIRAQDSVPLFFQAFRNMSEGMAGLVIAIGAGTAIFGGYLIVSHVF